MMPMNVSKEDTRRGSSLFSISGRVSKCVVRVAAFVCMVCFLVAIGAAQMHQVLKQKVFLDTNWEFRQQGTEGQSGWLPAQVPGDVHLDLLRNKLIPEPYYRDNESKIQWVESAGWTYRTTITAPADLLNQKHLELVFEGLDTNASVYLNDQLLLNADNMFRCWRVDVKSLLHAGSNQLRVEFMPPGKAAAARMAEDKHNGDTHVPDKSYLRKAAYEYGWDWGPRFVTSGVWRDVYLEGWDRARIAELQVMQPDVTANAAHLRADVTIVASDNMVAELDLSYSEGGKSVQSERSVTLRPGENKISVPVEIVKPALWFPAGYGKQPLYTFKADLKANSAIVDNKKVRTGLRSVVLSREKDQWGRSFGLVVNGIPIFAKGADAIPFDSFPSRVTEAQYRRVLESARDANMNMVRLWGGGYYESDKFYEICDELGLMVWQDFMFASSWYPGSYDWKHNVEAEAEYQVKRLRNHPSITVWSGNNEVESVLYAFLGGLSADGKLQVWKDYLTTFSGILPNVIEREDPEVPYWPSSPSANYEDTSDASQSGDAHDWSIWHGREPFANYEKHFSRFNSEYGFQSFPELRTVESFTTPEDRANIFTPVMLAHQKNNEGNSIIHDYLLRDYAEPKDFSSFLYVSQVLQAEGVKVGAEHMRRNRPRILGSLFWQLNDCWPVASWSSIDYYGRWKALQYYARRFYSPLLVSPELRDANVFIHVVSDKTQPVNGTLRVRVMTMQGAVVKQEIRQVTLAPLSAETQMQIPLESLVQGGRDLSELFVAADLTVDGAEVSRNILYLAPTKQVQLLPANIQSELIADKGVYKLKLSSSVLARDVYVTLGDLDVKISDNYFDLLPGEQAEITITSTAALPEIQKQLKIVSLKDAFRSETAKAEGAAK